MQSLSGKTGDCDGQKEENRPEYLIIILFIIGVRLYLLGRAVCFCRYSENIQRMVNESLQYC